MSFAFIRAFGAQASFVRCSGARDELHGALEEFFGGVGSTLLDERCAEHAQELRCIRSLAQCASTDLLRARGIARAQGRRGTLPRLARTRVCA